VRPVSPALQVVTQSASIHGFGTLALGLGILSGASAELGFAWTPARLLFLTETVLASTVLIGSVHYATNCVAFWNAGASSAFPFLVAHCSEFAKFPTTVYGRFLQIALTWVLPLAFVSYYPGATLLGKPEVSPWLGYATPLAALAIALVAGLIWRLGLRRYQGTGH
jgi:ABC-2 type transport system permease protein